MAEEKENSVQHSLEATEQFEKRLSIEQEKERLSFLPFFNFEPKDVKITGDQPNRIIEFTLHNLGANSAVNPHIEVNGSAISILGFYDDTFPFNDINYIEKIPISTAIVRVESVCHFTLNAYQFTSSFKEINIPPTLSFYISFYDLIGNNYRQRIFLSYDINSGEILERKIFLPDLLQPPTNSY